MSNGLSANRDFHLPVVAQSGLLQREDLAAREAAAWKGSQHQALAILFSQHRWLAGLPLSSEDSDSIFLVSQDLDGEVWEHSFPLCRKPVCWAMEEERAGFYLGGSLSFPCTGREGQRFCSAPQLCSPSHLLPGAGCGWNACAGGTARLADARGL